MAEETVNTTPATTEATAAPVTQTTAPATTTADTVGGAKVAEGLAADAPAVAETPAAEVDDFSWVPPTFLRDGTPDYKAMAKSYQALEKKIGKKGALAPASIDEYVIEGETKLDYDPETTKAFNERALAAGLSVEQMKWVRQEYEQDVMRFLPSIDKTSEVLSAKWGDDYAGNVALARKAALSGYLPSDVKNEDVLANPLALEILARLGSEMEEDSAPAAKSTAVSGTSEEEITAMIADPDYKKTNKRGNELRETVDKYYQKKFG